MTAKGFDLIRSQSAARARRDEILRLSESDCRAALILLSDTGSGAHVAAVLDRLRESREGGANPECCETEPEPCIRHTRPHPFL